jgi:hypothetical protein
MDRSRGQIAKHQARAPSIHVDWRDASTGMASEDNDGSTREVEMYIGVSLVGLLVLVLLVVWLF